MKPAHVPSPSPKSAAASQLFVLNALGQCYAEEEGPLNLNLLHLLIYIIVQLHQAIYIS